MVFENFEYQTEQVNMKIVAINGSHRGENGYTQFLINKLFEGAERAGAQCETLVLAKHKINRCLGCRVCHTQQSYLRCVYADKDDVAMLFDIMRKADLLIYATPIYIFTMSGLMKIFLDRITSTSDSSIPALSEAGLVFHHIDKELVSKPFVVLTCQDNFEYETHKNVILYFKTFSNFLDAPLVGELSRTLGQLVGQGIDKDRENKFPKIQEAYSAFVKAGEELAIHGKISHRTQNIANQTIIDMPKLVEILLKMQVIRKNKNIMEKVFQTAMLHITSQ